MHNMMKAGGTAAIHFDDLSCDGRTMSFDSDPGWLGVGNHTTFEERQLDYTADDASP
jgi:hypothetical protein